MNNNIMTLDTAKALMKAQRGWDWDDFTKVTAREFMCSFIRNGYPGTNSEDYIAERSVRWAMALTNELKKKLEPDADADFSGEINEYDSDRN